MTYEKKTCDWCGSAPWYTVGVTKYGRQIALCIECEDKHTYEIERWLV